MNLSTKNIPYGSLPYESVDTACRMMAKLYQKMPYLPMFPKISSDDTIVNRTFKNIPGVRIIDKKISLIISSNNYKNNLHKLEEAFNHPCMHNLDYFEMEAPFLEKFFQFINKFKSPNALINILGPFTVSQMLTQSAEEQMLIDKTYRKLFIQAVCVKALWMIEKLKEINPETVPVVMLEEPMFGKLGDIKRENEDISIELVTNMFSRVVEKLKQSGAIVGVQCFDKCDWKIPINAGVDIISFDAYNNPNNLSIIPEVITEFIARGGRINWGILPVVNEAKVKDLNIDEITSRLFKTFEPLIVAGVPADYVYKSALVSVQGDLNHLPIIFAEKVVILADQLSKRLPIKN